MILLQKFSGKGMANNRVYIDYDKRTVRFDPTPDKRTASRLFLEDLLTTTLIASLISAFVVILAAGIVVIGGGFLFDDPMIELPYFAHLVFLGTGIAIAAHLGKWCSKRWRSQCFPVWNKLNIMLCGHRYKKYTVNPNAIINNTFVVRQFSNVELSYDVTGDFATELESITIEEIYQDYPFKWYAIFRFKKQPVTGRMEVRTI